MITPLEKEVKLILKDVEPTEEMLATPAGELWMAYTARINQLESVLGVHGVGIAASIDALDRAMKAQGVI